MLTSPLFAYRVSGRTAPVSDLAARRATPRGSEAPRAWKSSSRRPWGLRAFSVLAPDVVSMKTSFPSANRDKVRGGPRGHQIRSPKQGRSSPMTIYYVGLDVGDRG